MIYYDVINLIFKNHGAPSRELTSRGPPNPNETKAATDSLMAEFDWKLNPYHIFFFTLVPVFLALYYG